MNWIPTRHFLPEDGKYNVKIDGQITQAELKRVNWYKRGWFKDGIEVVVKEWSN